MPSDLAEDPVHQDRESYLISDVSDVEAVWNDYKDSDLDETTSQSEDEELVADFVSGSDPLCGSDSEDSSIGREELYSDGVELPNDAAWWPYQNEKQCLLDVLSAFPRGSFSEAEMEITRWFASRLGVSNIPTVRTVKHRRELIRTLAGTKPRLLKSRIGNLYCKATIAQIIAHEVANPLVRKHLHFYPEKAGPRLVEARQADRWLYEVQSTFSGPMVRVSGQDYFVEEPALAKVGPTQLPTAVFPIRFFESDGQQFATVHRLSVTPGEDGYIIEAWQASDCFDISVSSFVLSYPQFMNGHNNYGLPSPSKVRGIRRRVSVGPASLQTETTNWTGAIPNPWRAKADGKRVLTMPMWWYCDDTSGNSSKKWNKHNSFLFVLGGLPHDQVHLAYNIHFVSTSNIAPPLEMLEGIVDELAGLQQDGVVAWDCVFQEDVLFIPWVLAFLGDNPMQSELASHIGLQGKYFCRVCHASKNTTRTFDIDSERARVLEFLVGGRLRTRDETLAALKDQWNIVMSGAPSRVDSAATATGVKDKYMGSIIDTLAPKIAALKGANRRSGLPETTGIEIDPNQDTPVEILHVVLLGFVKYFWRDAVSRQNATGKKTLKTRLSSLDVSDLGLDPLNGHTLVQYAKSLTGRDFRMVVQVAPAVLYDLVPKPAYRAWLALCRLCPLVFQNEIPDRSEYMTALANAIDDFLLTTALWNVQWFNKPRTATMALSLIAKQLMGMARIVTPSDGGQALSAPLLAENPECLWEETLAAQLADQQTPLNAALTPLFRCRSLRMPNGDTIRVRSHVLFTDSQTSTTRVGRVLEILRREDTVVGVLLQAWQIGITDEDYCMPVVTPVLDSHIFVKMKNIICGAHTFHNCKKHRCIASQTRPAKQERTLTGTFYSEYQHDQSPDDRILNLAQLRSATSLYPFRSQHRDPTMSREDVVSYALMARDLERSKLAPPTPRTPRRQPPTAVPPRTPIRPRQGVEAIPEGYTPTPTPSKRRRLDDDSDIGTTHM
ncbi:hypothetical protein NM688_g5919 [Phlebia brevispora]|uniref:Uncharacterized protein n=1 Tax=Phlebia brevispora TaxID=194682 RepID=A0ACC1SMT5_9APHY|nr:hypothetical protein NM688_g5919 [Phlebia brevispora]